NQEKVLDRLAAWRKQVPDLTIRSTFIVGFPGETEAEFEELLEWLEEAQIDRLGCFQYEPVTGAPSNDLPGAVPDAVKQERFDRLMALQQEISAAKQIAKIGREIDVIIDDVDEDEAIGRSSADAPDIDGQVYLDGENELEIGEIVRVRVTDADAYDLWGEVVE
ncbi:MAG: TRAM domain-containing protein, partial [Alphaproteobacteria bacterium]|nr:TRAM domain-containing protein [Alphaproteobacteria bacterium]